ncbi:MAG: hypothetical protein R3B70_23175 [Polyangiaceae bacterium]
MEIREVNAPSPVTSGKSFKLVIQHSTDCEGVTVSIRVIPNDTFSIDRSSVTLGAGTSTEARSTVTRNTAANDACSIKVTLGDSTRVATVEVT